jgi:transposase
VTVADVARQHGTTRWQIYDWRKQINDNLLNGIHSSTQNFAPPLASAVLPGVLEHKKPPAREAFKLLI